LPLHPGAWWCLQIDANLGRINMKQPYPIAPGDTLDFEFDWTADLAADGDTITTIVLTPSDGMTVLSSAEAAGIVKFWVHMSDTLTIGQLEIVQCKITTASTPNRVRTKEMRFIAQR
jgi:hypothetical protein